LLFILGGLVLGEELAVLAKSSAAASWLYAVHGRLCFWWVGKVDLGIRQIRKPLQLPALSVSDGFRK
jgi:hypothetical protein